MLKRIRDFIYDINDIFVAIVILLAAAGIIVWRSTAIMAYPEYLAAKNPSSNTTNVDFSGIDLTPDPVENINENPEKIDTSNIIPNQGTEDPSGTTDPNQGTEDPSGTVDPNQGTEDPNGTTDPDQGTEDPNGTTDPNQGGETTTPPEDGTQTGTQNGSVTATIIVDAKGETWNKVVNKLIEAGLMTSDEKTAFMDKLRELKLDTKLIPGTYELTNTSYEDMIKKMCRQ